MRRHRRYLVLAAHPDRESLWLEWPNAFGARWSSLVLRSQGWAVTVLPSLPPPSAGRRLRATLTPIYS
jgi:hypothetical protein